MLLQLLAAASLSVGGPPPAKRLNLLYVLVDDLRPEIGAYGARSAQHTANTPNLDALAAEALLFERAFCQQAVCGPSRNSFLSGRRPDVTTTWTFANSFRFGASPDPESPVLRPGWTSMLGFLKSKGYTVAGQGKIYHPRSPPNDDGDKSWSAAFLPYPEWSQGGDRCPGGGYEMDPFTEQPVHTRSQHGPDRRRGTALSGPLFTISTVLSWICVGTHMCGALPSPVCA